MANSTSVKSQNFHVRSISLPSRSHPLVLTIEEELNNLNSWVASNTTMENACSHLQSLGEIYKCIDELLHLPSILQAFSHSNEKSWLEMEIEVSVKLLDLCGAIKDNMVTVEGHVQELQSSLRRKGDSASEDFIRAQIFSKKETRNNIKKCQQQLRRIEVICRSCSSIVTSCDQSVVSVALVKSRGLTISLLSRVLAFLSMPRQNRKAGGRWSIVSKVIKLRKVACDENQEDGSYSKYCYKDMEVGLECLFRRLIQNRVSLLNILSL